MTHPMPEFTYNSICITTEQCMGVVMLASNRPQAGKTTDNLNSTPKGPFIIQFQQYPFTISLIYIIYHQIICLCKICFAFSKFIYLLSRNLTKMRLHQIAAFLRPHFFVFTIGSKIPLYKNKILDTQPREFLQKKNWNNISLWGQDFTKYYYWGPRDYNFKNDICIRTLRCRTVNILFITDNDEEYAILQQ